MAAQVDAISPGRGRATDTGVVIDGSGFSPTPTNNTVTVDGQAAVITAESATQITITIPGGITEDRHVVVSVTNDDDATTDTIFWWSKLNAAALDTVNITGQVPGPFEDPDPTTESPNTAEAKDYEKLATLVERNRSRLDGVPSQTQTAVNVVGPTALTDVNQTVLVDTTAAGADATVTTPGTHTAGTQIAILNIGTSGFNAIVDPGTDSISGATNDRILHDGQWLIIESDGTDWFIVSVTTEPGPLWNINQRAESADFTLTDADKPIQIIEVDTEPILITLPVITAITPHFLMGLDNNAGTPFIAVVVDDNGDFTVGRLLPDKKMIWFRHTGVGGKWFTDENGFAYGEYYLHYGGNENATNRRKSPHGQGEDTTTSTDGGPEDSILLPCPTKLISFGGRGTNTVTNPITIRSIDSAGSFLRNEILVMAMNNNFRDILQSGHVPENLFDPGASNDRFQIVTEAALGLSTEHYLMKQTEDIGYAPLYQFGAFQSVANRFARSNGVKGSIAVGSSSLFAEHTVLETTVLGAVIFDTDLADATTVFDFFVNNSSVGTFSGVAGGTGIGIVSGGPHTLTEGDVIAIRNTSGTNPGDGIYKVGVQHDGRLIFFGGDLDAVNKNLEINGEADEPISVSDLIINQFIVHEHLNLVRLGWQTTVTGATSTIRLYKNGTVGIVTQNMTTAIGTVDLTGAFSQLLPGDKIQIDTIGVTNPGNTIVTLYAR